MFDHMITENLYKSLFVIQNLKIGGTVVTNAWFPFIGGIFNFELQKMPSTCFGNQGTSWFFMLAVKLLFNLY